MIATSQRESHDYIPEISGSADIRVGSPLPLGTQESEGGVNFSIFSRDASRVRLELFVHPEDAKPAHVFDLDSKCNRTGDVWHIWIKVIVTGQCHAYRVDGPYEPGKGHRFNFNRLLWATSMPVAAPGCQTISSRHSAIISEPTPMSGSMPRARFTRNGKKSENHESN